MVNKFIRPPSNKGIRHRCPELTVLVKKQHLKIFVYVSNQPVCASPFIKIVFLMLNYNYCCILELCHLQFYKEAEKGEALFR